MEDQHWPDTSGRSALTRHQWKISTGQTPVDDQHWPDTRSALTRHQIGRSALTRHQWKISTDQTPEWKISTDQTPEWKISSRSPLTRLMPSKAKIAVPKKSGISATLVKAGRTRWSGSPCVMLAKMSTIPGSQKESDPHWDETYIRRMKPPDTGWLLVKKWR